jgi:Tfp pilus assembly protein PilN
MRAVNLIPSEARKGGGAGAAGRSGGGAYVLLGGLAVLVVLVALWALAGHGISGKKNDLTKLQNETAAAKAQAGSLAAYNDYSKVRQDRVATVRSLALSRFDWAKALDAVSRTLPNDAWVTSMTGTAAPGVAVDGGGSSAAALRGQRPVPAIELVGCTESMGKVARLISRLRAVPGVDRVSIADSKKADSAGGSDSCRGGHANYPQFNLVLFFGNNVPQTGPATPNATGAAPAPATPPATPQSGSSTPSSGSSSTPAAGATNSTSSSSTAGTAPASGASR